MKITLYIKDGEGGFVLNGRMICHYRDFYCPINFWHGLQPQNYGELDGIRTLGIKVRLNESIKTHSLKGVTQKHFHSFQKQLENGGCTNCVSCGSSLLELRFNVRLHMKFLTF